MISDFANSDQGTKLDMAPTANASEEGTCHFHARICEQNMHRNAPQCHTPVEAGWNLTKWWLTDKDEEEEAQQHLRDHALAGGAVDAGGASSGSAGNYLAGNGGQLPVGGGRAMYTGGNGVVERLGMFGTLFARNVVDRS